MIFSNIHRHMYFIYSFHFTAYVGFTAIGYRHVTISAGGFLETRFTFQPLCHCPCHMVFSVFFYVFFRGMLRICGYVSTSLILSPTDYQSILAELQSPAALHSDSHFLDPELPVTPNPSLAHHQPEPDTPLLAHSHRQPLPWSPEIEPGSREADSPPRSPPRPCELTLSFPVFELPDPVPSKVRKPHIALNDQLLLSEEEDRPCDEMELSHRPRSPSFPAMCELDTFYFTSSPSLSSISSITPSTPDRAQIGDTGLQIGSPYGVQGVVGLNGSEKKVTEEIKNVVEMVAAEVAEENGLKWVEQDLIKNVERKCEMITKDRSKLAEESKGLVEQREESALEEQHVLVADESKETACGMEEVIDVQSLSEEQNHVIESEQGLEKVCTTIKAMTVKEDIDEKSEVQEGAGGGDDSVHESNRVDNTDGQVQFKDEGSCDCEKDISGTAEGDQAAEDQALDSTLPSGLG